MKFQNEIVFITGASSGIGLSTALHFARQGADVGVLARSGAKLEHVKAEIEGLGRRCEAYVGDVRDREFVFETARQICSELGPVSILVNNAGMGVGGAVFEVPLEEIQELMDVNFFGVIHTAQAFLPGMMERRRGCIVNISSILGKASFPFTGYYCASKFAITALSDAWRIELRPFNVHVLNVCPGSTSGTEFHNHAKGPKDRLPRRYEMTADEVGRRIVRATAAKKREIILTAGGRFFVTANRLVPGLTYQVLRRVVPYLRKRSEGL
ncbi:MAG TPA: SDR family NAD(P)-dependent oxidoreductase [Acidobacteriota bacterium]|jgi:3-oxoacyl-[acyl-carrier protein] reductase